MDVIKGLDPYLPGQILICSAASLKQTMLPLKV